MAPGELNGARILWLHEAATRIGVVKSIGPSGKPTKGHPLLLGSVVCLVLLGACRASVAEEPQPTSTPAAPSAAPSEPWPDGLSDAEARTLSSLELVDPYPLYTMHYFGPYGTETVDAISLGPHGSCSLFAALGDHSARLYGRNFDWEYSPAVLLFTDPPDGYASVSMVDIAYLFGDLSGVATLDERPLEDRRRLLWTPHLPFDGMNEQGLVVGMASVPWSSPPRDPSLPTVDDIELMRWMLDRARTVDEAVDVLRGANISWSGGVTIHYLIADASGKSALVEYVQGKMVVLPATEPWHLATNFYVSTASDGPVAPPGSCPRYDRLVSTLRRAGGVLQVDQALDLLHQVSNERTQWSVIYDLSRHSVHVVMAGKFETVYTFEPGS